MIEAPALLRHPEIRHGFFTRCGGTSSGAYSSLNCGISGGDAPEKVAANRTRVATALGVFPDRLVTARQVHSAIAVVVEEPFEQPPQADALVTARPDIALGVLTADCTPVLLADPVAQVIGAAHAGWRGALDGILEATISAMETLGARAWRITATIGPCIQQRSYEVGAEFHARFMAANPAWAEFFIASKNSDHFMFDLPGFCARRLERQSLNTVSRVESCTYCDEDEFFSYRRVTHQGNSLYGNQISAITLGPGISAR